MKTDRENVQIRQLNARTFDKAVERGVVLVHFGEPWCSLSKMQLMVLMKLAVRFRRRAIVAEVNVDNARNLAVRFGVECLPTILLFKDGHLRQQFVGVQRESRLAQTTQALISESQKPPQGCPLRNNT